MKTFPAAFTVEKDKPTGAKPVWVLKLTVNSVAYYLAGRTLSIAPLSVTAYGLIQSWGSVRQGVSGALDEFPVAEIGEDLILDPDSPVDLEAMLVDGNIEDSASVMYLWFEGCTAAPQAMFSGYVRNVELDDTTAHLSEQDESVKLEKYFVGKKVALADYPFADPEEVGKLLPVPFGTIPKYPALGLYYSPKSTLMAACNDSATTITVSEAAKFPVGSTLIVDTEQMYVWTTDDVNTITVTRGYNSTTAVAHNQAAAALRLVTLAYCASWRAVNALPRVWLRRDGLDLDVTAYCTRYTGQTGSQLAGYGSMAMVTFTASQMAQIVGMTALDIDVDDTIALDAQDQYQSVDLDRTGSTGTVDYLLSIINGNLQEGTLLHPLSSVDLGKTKLVSATGRPTHVRACAYAGSASYPDNGNLILHWAGSSVDSFTIGGSSPDVFRGDWVEIDGWADFNHANTYVHIQPVTSGNYVWVWEVWLEVTYNPTASSTATPGVAKTGTVGVVLSGSIVADYFGAGKILVDIQADRGSPAGVMNWILDQAGFPALTVVGTLAVNAFSGVIQEYQNALWWLNALAMQCWSWFSLTAGTPRLVSRLPSTPVKNIPACRIDNDGRRIITRRKTDVSELINKITVLYNRDWSQDGDSAYRDSLTMEDAASQAAFGVQERPELFKTDFIRFQAQAHALAAAALADMARRHWLAETELFLDNCELEFGDSVQLLDLFKGKIISAGPSPGSSNRIDTLQLTVRSD